MGRSGSDSTKLLDIDKTMGALSKDEKKHVLSCLTGGPSFGTPLHWGVKNGDIRGVTRLLSHVPDDMKQDVLMLRDDMGTPLHMAARSKDLTMARALLDTVPRKHVAPILEAEDVHGHTAKGIALGLHLPSRLGPKSDRDMLELLKRVEHLAYPES
uniref:Uncharacterized protein n=1 Tax=Zooxanthella nutricula TaxID=1333877 RepID=A0A7S2ND10_9DINO